MPDPVPARDPAPVRFDCPACGATLTVPAAAASGLQGPCPKCWQEIVSPNLATGRPARLPAPPPAPTPTPPLTPAETAETAAAPAPASAPDLAPDLDPAAAAPVAKSGGTGWMIPTLLSSLVFGAAGYYVGKIQPLPAAAPPAAATAPAPAPQPLPEPATDLTDVPESDPEPDEETVPASASVPPPAPPALPLPAPPAPPALPPPAPPSPEATLRAFLEAADWKTRGTRVLMPDDILPAMEKYAAEAGDGPIATTSVSLLEVAGPTHIFKVCTPSIAEGFPVAVSTTAEGPRIDWESFIGFHDDHFRKFLEGPSGKSGIFDLLVKPEPEQPGDAAAHFVRIRLSVPMPGRESVAWIRKDSVALARLRAIFDGSGGFDKATIDKLLAETGVPLVLALVKRDTNDGRSFIEIEDFTAVGWGPAGR